MAVKKAMTLNFGLRLLALKTEQQMSTIILNAVRADLVTVLFMLNALLTFQFVLLAIATVIRVAQMGS